MYHRTKAEKIFQIFNVIIMLLICASMVYPFLYLLARSLSSPEISSLSFSIIPQGTTLENFGKVLGNEDIAVGFKNALLRTLLGTAVNLIMTVFAAYPLSKRYFPHRTFWMGLVIFTMFFSGGLIPSYLLIKKLHLLNTLWVLIIPGAISTYNMIIMRNFFMSLPESLEEAALIDGANEMLVLFRIVIPMSKPILATIALWSMVGHWNAWFDALIYNTEPSLQVLQVVMRRIVLEGTAQMLNPNASSNNFHQIVNPENIKAATIMVTTIPIIMVYPFLQKYFVKGILVGSLKG
ncbi:carbohydrate ABC transporter permease [Ructibacterium gallinarum]|uniref:Carbohydrate ABC transporter permease n=1 Tax=Ructibacterium gallinarum TaxID=2779355 RepID=A0A9D5R8P5_9FIRM|nr:carbohydrate ABC transporter permease [Ructibacterium gallinarum]MBE5040631.1 carbohydrate ABC transporter permease [Ructibacterium gallinarum]